MATTEKISFSLFFKYVFFFVKPNICMKLNRRAWVSGVVARKRMPNKIKPQDNCFVEISITSERSWSLIWGRSLEVTISSWDNAKSEFVTSRLLHQISDQLLSEVIDISSKQLSWGLILFGILFLATTPLPKPFD